MKTRQPKWKKNLSGALIIFCCAVLETHAQQRGGAAGGFPAFRPFGFFNNAASSSSSSTYNNNGTVGTATFSVDPNTHNIIVVTDSQTAAEISNVINHLERPVPQVLLNCVFLQVQHNNSLDLGVEGGWTGNAGNNQVSAANIFGLSGLNSVATNFTAMGQPLGSGFPTPLSTAGSGGLYQILGSDYQATLRALAQSGKAQVLSRPSVLASDGQPAQVIVGQYVPLVTSVSYSGVNANVPVSSIQYSDVGIILNVTPYISLADNTVEMILQPQTSAVDPTLNQTISPGVTAPYIDVTSANTVAVTPNGQTVVIGGLMENDQSSSSSKIPLLGDIPVLGNLFKSKSNSNAKKELLIFVTPHIVEAPTQFAGMPGGPDHLPGLITNSVSEQELNQFLERLPTKKGP
jgi:general secretion pathway protein D